MSRKIVEGEMVLKFKCPACRKKIEETVRASYPDIKFQEPQSPLGTKMFFWEGQCPECYHWVEVMA